MKVSELINRTTMQIVKYGRNLDVLGWTEGYLVVRFRGRPTLYVYGPDIPEDEIGKLLRTPFPDALFENNIKSKFKCHKVSHV